ncbi:pyridoxal phosphate-dependent class II aminotransferase [Halomonas campisalis]|uniref:Pyridoxal phosphate-dependent class II aminotransferase n=1 Tax=Billgrantia campisalis TaxID=74661 RepID=A0ABS9PBZ1_9GAMM|nr:aminotransferase class I/II-fold pyridoxal phosphate-dependent enzyme [Halomonas campisalis]MCG6659290.1 pyridoxal phosphate-dependent class II aminotransferase [Halomonas campisalis]MDR5864289.1 aminotransferase class I/II-fold pyridoxal phosphate-dependent enzyme [Halomonas campisalis]
MNETAPWPAHGGQADALLARYGLPADHPLVDFSANLNPLGPPAWVPARLAELAAGLARYPAPDYAEARAAIARREGVGVDQVLLTNGGAEAIFLVAAASAGRRAAIVQPTFTEYARACRACGLAVDAISLAPPDFALDPERVAAQLGGCGLLFLCRPNNPTGTLVPREAVERLLALTEPLGCRVVIDEAFIDFVVEGDERLTPLLGRFPHLLLLRSLTKCYTLPGLRLGYLLADSQTVRRVGAHQPPWSVNHLAAELVAPLLDDGEFMARMRTWLLEERPRLALGLARRGLRVVPSRANFFLVRPALGPERLTGQSPRHTMPEPRAGRRGGHLPGMANVAPMEGFTAPPRRPVDGSTRVTGPAAMALVSTDALFERLLRCGILVRHTHNFAGLDGGWLRLALRDRADNDRLLAALSKEGEA